jgi:hypothetical protein
LSENATSTAGEDPASKAAACGTIETPKGGGGPGGTFPLLVLGFMLSLLLGSVGKKSKNFLS